MLSYELAEQKVASPAYLPGAISSSGLHPVHIGQWTANTVRNRQAETNVQPEFVGLVRQIYADMFDQLSNSLVTETRHISSTSAMKQHPAFQALVSLGDATVSAILARLRTGRIHVQWFTLLRVLTGEDPVAPVNRGYVDRMTRDWLDWAARRP